MKKLLISALALTMSVTCAYGLAACGDPDDSGNKGPGGNNPPSTMTDAEAVQAAITSVKTMYLDKSADTPVDYQVVGQTIVSGVSYSIDWSVSDNVANIVSVGDMDASTKQVTISVAEVTEEVEYTLTASITVGEETAKAEFSRVIPVIYTASEVLELAKDLGKDEYYKVNGAEKKLYVKGYVVDTGTWGANYNNFTSVYIADSADKTKEEGLQVYRLDADGTFIKGEYDLINGSYIVVGGYLQNYKGDTPEITYGNTDKTNPKAVKYEKKQLTEAEKIEMALATVADIITITKAGDVALATSPISDVTFEWAIKEGTAATLSNGKLNVAALPAEDATVVLTLTVKCGNTTETKEVTVTIKAFVADSITASVNIKTYADEHNWDASVSNGSTTTGPKYQTVNIDDKVTATTNEGTNNNGRYYASGAGSWRLYKSESAVLTISVVSGYKLVSVTITYASGNFVDSDGITSGVPKAVSGRSVTFTVGANIQINAMEVVYAPVAEGEHEHEWTATHVDGTWTHTATCSGCDEVQGATECVPVLNVCPDCKYEYTATEIVNALYALGKDESLNGTYKLTGVVTAIEEQSTQYKNATFTIKVADKDVLVYRATGDGYDTLKLFDTVTVTGSLVDYNNKKEFTQGCKIVEVVPGVDTRSDAEKVAAALENVEATLTVSVAGSTTLHVSSEADVTFEWTVAEGTPAYVSITADGKLHVEALPNEETTVTIIVTASCNDASDKKEVTVTIKAAPVVNPGEETTLTLTKDTLFPGLTGTNYATYNGEHTVGNYVITTNQVLGNTYGDAKYSVLQFQKAAGTITFDGEFTKIKLVLATTYDYASANNVTVYAGATALTANLVDTEKTGTKNGNYEVQLHTIEYTVVGTGVQTIKLADEASSAVYLESIVLTTGEGTGSNPGGGEDNPSDEAALALTKDSLFPGLTGTNYATYNGEHTVGDYVITTNQVLGNTYGDAKYSVLQFQKAAGTITFDGEFTKIKLVLATTYDYASANNVTVYAGTTALTANLVDTEKTGTKNGNYEVQLHTIEYTVVGTGVQTIKLADEASSAVYLTIVEFYGAESGEGGNGGENPGESALVATFALGADGATTHADGTAATAYTETSGNYTLEVTATTNDKFFTGARDAKGNGCFKLGTGSAVGSFTFTVANDVTKVVIYVACYKANKTNVTVNGGDVIAIDALSDNGEYTAVEIDTTTNKTITFATATGGLRCMVNTIEFYA